MRRHGHVLEQVVDDPRFIVLVEPVVGEGPKNSFVVLLVTAADHEDEGLTVLCSGMREKSSLTFETYSKST